MVNSVVLIGRLGRDPELRSTANGTPVCSFSLATDERRKAGVHTEWHNIVAWDKLADICAKFLAKGKLVYIQGRLQTRDWDDREGNKRRTTEVIADQMRMLERAEEKFEASEPFPQITDDDVPF